MNHTETLDNGAPFHCFARTPERRRLLLHRPLQRRPGRRRHDRHHRRHRGRRRRPPLPADRVGGVERQRLGRGRPRARRHRRPQPRRRGRAAPSRRSHRARRDPPPQRRLDPVPRRSRARSGSRRTAPRRASTRSTAWTSGGTVEADQRRHRHRRDRRPLRGRPRAALRPPAPAGRPDRGRLHRRRVRARRLGGVDPGRDVRAERSGRPALHARGGDRRDRVRPGRPRARRHPPLLRQGAREGRGHPHPRVPDGRRPQRQRRHRDHQRARHPDPLHRTRLEPPRRPRRRRRRGRSRTPSCGARSCCARAIAPSPRRLRAPGGAVELAGGAGPLRARPAPRTSTAAPCGC